MPSQEHETGDEERTEHVSSPSEWRFLIDENLPHDLAVSLNAMDYVAEHVVDMGLRGQPDAAVYAYAQTHQTTLITADLGFGNALRYPPPHAGIVVVRVPDTLSIAQRLQVIVDGLGLLAGQSFKDTLVTIEIGHVRVRRQE